MQEASDTFPWAYIVVVAVHAVVTWAVFRKSGSNPSFARYEISHAQPKNNRVQFD
jgi:hypothetical protein